MVASYYVAANQTAENNHLSNLDYTIATNHITMQLLNMINRNIIYTIGTQHYHFKVLAGINFSKFTVNSAKLHAIQ